MNKIILAPITFLMFMLFSFSAGSTEYSAVSSFTNDTVQEFNIIMKDGDDDDGDDGDDGGGY